MIKAIAFFGILGIVCILLGSFFQGIELSVWLYLTFYIIGSISLGLAILMWLIWDDNQ